MWGGLPPQDPTQGHQGRPAQHASASAPTVHMHMQPAIPGPSVYRQTNLLRRVESLLRSGMVRDGPGWSAMVRDGPQQPGTTAMVRDGPRWSAMVHNIL